MGGLLTRVAHVADDARKIDDPHLMCEKVIQFETCTFAYSYIPLATYSFSSGCLRPSGWAPHALCLLVSRQRASASSFCVPYVLRFEKSAEKERKKRNFRFRRTRFFHYPKSASAFSQAIISVPLLLGGFLVHLSRVSSTLLICFVQCFYNHRETRNEAYRNLKESK